MKRFFVLLGFTAFLTVACTKSSNTPSTGGDVRRPNNDGQMRPGMPTEEQRKQMEACVEKKGMKMPERPQFTDAQRAAMAKCRAESRSGGPASFQACVKKAGVTLPAPPTPEQLAVLRGCRQEVLGK